MTKAKINPWVNYRDVSYLTPYEEKIYTLLSDGYSYKQIAEMIGNKPLSVKSRIPVIKEKVPLHELNQKQARYSAL